MEEIPSYFSVNISKEAAEQVSQIIDVVTSLSDASVELHKISNKISGDIQRVEQKLEGNYVLVFHPRVHALTLSRVCRSQPKANGPDYGSEA